MIGKVVTVATKAVNTMAKVSVSEVTKVVDGVKAIGTVAGMVPSKKKSLAEVTEDLKRLKELKDLGILSEEEFDEKKKKYMEML